MSDDKVQQAEGYFTDTAGGCPCCARGIVLRDALAALREALRVKDEALKALDSAMLLHTCDEAVCKFNNEPNWYDLHKQAQAALSTPAPAPQNNLSGIREKAEEVKMLCGLALTTYPFKEPQEAFDAAYALVEMLAPTAQEPAPQKPEGERCANCGGANGRWKGETAMAGGGLYWWCPDCGLNHGR